MIAIVEYKGRLLITTACSVGGRQPNVSMTTIFRSNAKTPGSIEFRNSD